MNGRKQFTSHKPTRLLPGLGMIEPLEFDLFGQTCAILETDAVGPVGAYLANLSALSESLISRFLAAPDTAALAVLCRSLGLTRSEFEALTICCAPTLGNVSLAPASALFDALSRARADRIVAHWRDREPGGVGPARYPVLGPRRDA